MVGNERRDLRRKARDLRNNMTKAEILLWSRLRSRKVGGYKFRRQQPIFDFIVDFYCHELKLIVEVDGEVHTFSENYEKDRKRDLFFINNGYKILRFTNYEIEINLKDSVNKIATFISREFVPLQGDLQGVIHDEE